jgi:hypothetical protein
MPVVPVESLVYSLFPSKTTYVLDSYFATKRIRLTHHEETTKTQSDLNRSPQQQQNSHNHMSNPMFLQCYIGVFQNDTSLKTALATSKRC